MIEEEEMEKQVNDGTFDECAYVKMSRMMMIYVLLNFKSIYYFEYYDA